MIKQITANGMNRLMFFVLLLMTSPSLYSATFIVMNNNDSGPHSLRQQIILSNSTAGLNTINFSAPFQIILLSDLPAITNPVIIDGYSAPGSMANTNPITAANNAVIAVELRGPGPGVDLPVLNGLLLGAGSDGSTIRGLAINNFASVPSANVNDGGAGIRIESNNNTIEGNFIGTDTTGLQNLPNFSAIRVIGNDNLIGGTVAASRNLLSGMYGGVRLSTLYNGVVKINGLNTVVQGNTIGLNAPGTSPLHPSATVGVMTSQGDGTIIGGPSHLTNGNVISGHRAANIFFNLIQAPQTIQGNYIGTDVSGTTAAGMNNGMGIIASAFVNAPQNLLIDSNLVSGNSYGMRIGENSFSLFPIIGAKITNNLIGTDVTGALALPNTFDGIWLTFAQNTFIALNTISGNGRHGISTGKAENSRIVSNTIGATLGGGSPLGNGGDGIKLGTNVGAGIPAMCDVIGGAKPGEGNLIATNGGNGIEIVSYTEDETIIGNTIAGNLLNGILINPLAEEIFIGNTKNAGDERFIGGIAIQGNSNIGPLGTSNIITTNHGEGIRIVNAK